MKRILLLLLTGITLTAQGQTRFRELSFKEAIETAKAEQKLVFIDMMTTWCGPCKVMARDVFPQKKVGDYMNSHFVCMKIDAEKGEGIEIAKTYQVTAYPTFLILDTNKRLVAQSVGMKQADDFIAELERLVNPDATPEKMKARYESGDRTPKLVKDYAAFLKNEARKDRRNGEKKMEEVAQLVKDYFTGLTDAQKLDPENMFIYAGYVNSTEDTAAKFMTQNVKKFPETSRGEINTIINKLYQREEYALLSHEKETTKPMIDTFKKELKQLNLNADGHYDNSMKLIEAYNGDGQKYMQLCREVFKSLNQTQQSGLMDSLSRKFANADDDTKKEAARVIREQLADMDANMLMSGVMAIMRLEIRGH